MDDAVEIEAVRFLGASLWTDYALYRTPSMSMSIAGRTMNDHRFIFAEAGSAPLRPEQALEWHQTSKAWLSAQLHPSKFDDKTVVVTRHLPHPRSIAAHYAGDPLNPAFTSDMSDLVEDSNAAVWVHGHTHSSFDYMAGRTRVICNPKSYGPYRKTNSHS